MKHYFPIFLCLLLICCIQPIAAQQSSATSNNPPPPTSGKLTKIAVIDTEAFYDPDKGIARMVKAAKDVGQEFEPLNKELQERQQQYQTLADEINKLEPAADPRVIQEKKFEASRLQRELKNKSEDAETAFRKRLEAVLAPIEEDLLNALASYAEQRGIAVVIDGSRAQELILYVAEAADITRDFIAEYNRRAAATPPSKP